MVITYLPQLSLGLRDLVYAPPDQVDLHHRDVLEGVVSKRRASTYTAGRGRHWLKLKTPTWRQANKDRWERRGAK
jgi:hypothetical protein